MKTLNENYSKNIEILKKNLELGMGYTQAIKSIDYQKMTFRKHNLLDEMAQDYIRELEAVLFSHFSKVEINIVSKPIVETHYDIVE
jgi:hypothetical protein